MAGGYTRGGTEMADKQVPPALATTADGASGAAACRGAASDVFLRPLGNPPDADNANLVVAGGRGTADGATDCGVAVANHGPGQRLQPSPAPHQPQGADGPAWKDYQTVFTNAKAGMDGVDKARVQQVVWEMSKDSAHFKNEQRKQASVLERIERMKQRSAALTTMELTAAGRAMDARIAGCEARRDLTRTWLHVDMDCFYAAVHEREQPELKRLPVAVGGMGMISTANYVARRFGVRSAMPGFIGKRLCPKLVFVKPDFAKYTEAAEVVRGAFRQLDPDFESGGLDEAYLDVTGYCTRTATSGEEAATELRRLVKEVSGGLTCSVGVACNKMLAKICSDINKPDGQYVLPASRAAVMSFLDTLPVRKIPCIGKVTEQVLQGVLGVSTCGQLLAPASRCRLPLLFSEAAAGFFLEAALGLAPTRHGPKTDTSVDPGRKGLSHERTFRDMSAPAEQEAMAKKLVEALVADMAEEGIEGRNITLKLKLSTFEMHTRAATMPRHVRTVSDILPAVLRLLRAEMPVTLRLMGVRMAMLRKVNAGAKSPLARLLGLRNSAQHTDEQQATAAGTTPADATSPQPLGCGSAPPACAATAAVGMQAAASAPRPDGGAAGAAGPAASAPAGRLATGSVWPAAVAAAAAAGNAAVAHTTEPGGSPQLLARGYGGHDDSKGGSGRLPAAPRPPRLQLLAHASAPGGSGHGPGPGSSCGGGGSTWAQGQPAGAGSAPTTPRTGIPGEAAGGQALGQPPRPPAAAASSAAACHGEAWACAGPYAGGAWLWDTLEVEEEEEHEAEEHTEIEAGLQDLEDEAWPQQQDRSCFGGEADDATICILDSDDDEGFPLHADQTEGRNQPQSWQQQERGHEQEAHGHAAHKRCAEPAATGPSGAAAGPGHKRPRCQGLVNVGEAGVSGAAVVGPGASVAAATQPMPAAATWVCLVCTYARNRRQFLRCEMCDTRRGSSRTLT